MIAFVAGWFGVEIFAWLRPLDVSAPTILLAVTACVGSFLGAVAAHNAVHCPVFRSRRLDAAWRCVLTLVYGHPVTAYVPGHNLSHHRHLETERDVMRTTKARARYNLVNLLCFAPSISSAMLATEIGYLRFAWRRRPRMRRQFLIEALVAVTAMASLGVLDWRKLVVFVLLPHAYAAWGIITMNLLQHDGADASSTYNHSRSFVGPIINWLTFNNGYHAMHHMRPQMHWSLMPEAHAKLVAPFVDRRLVETSFAAYLFRAYVFPGLRSRYDGPAVEARAAGADAPWYG